MRTTAATGARSKTPSGGSSRSCSALGLPGQVEGRRGSGARRDVRFPALSPGRPRVLTGHANGLITLNVEEADDSLREKIRARRARAVSHAARPLPPRDRPLLLGPPRRRTRRGIEPFRALFGDERADYAAALQRNYEQRPAARLAPTATSAPTPRAIRGRTGRRAGPTTCTWSTASTRRSGFGLAGEDVEADDRALHARRPLRARRCRDADRVPVAGELLGAS